MCHFKTWYFDEHGYVVSCEHCNHFQVSFGTTMLTLSPTDYEVLVKMVAQRKEDHVPMHNPNVRCVVLPTPCSNIHSFLSERELQLLHDMLQEADNEIKTQQMIRLF
ncbi:MAG: hypothetical protein J0H74_28555 [Chitinophagaceae bacterium]|nr:hypothetical protein [Chitinophagaceae bacterium]